MAALNSCCPALVSNTCCSINHNVFYFEFTSCCIFHFSSLKGLIYMCSFKVWWSLVRKSFAHIVQHHIKKDKAHIFSHVRPFYEWAMSDLDRSMHRSLWVQVAHSSFTEGSHTTKNTAWGLFLLSRNTMECNILDMG